MWDVSKTGNPQNVGVPPGFTLHPFENSYGIKDMSGSFLGPPPFGGFKTETTRKHPLHFFWGGGGVQPFEEAHPLTHSGCGVPFAASFSEA